VVSNACTWLGSRSSFAGFAKAMNERGRMEELKVYKAAIVASLALS
jgi:hypothetical protein